MALIAPTVPERPGVRTGTVARRLSLPSLAIAAATTWLLWVGATTLDRSGQLGATLAGGWLELVGPVLIAVVTAAVICERLWPAQPRPLLAPGHVQDGFFFIVYAGCVVPVMTLLGVAFAALLGTTGAGPGARGRRRGPSGWWYP
jgi:hypothetical protein